MIRHTLMKMTPAHMTHRPLSQPVRASLGVLAALTIGFSMTALSASAETPQQAIARAHASAKRSAATESALATLEREFPAQAQAPIMEPVTEKMITPSEDVIAAGRKVAPLATAHTLPRDWIEAGLDPSKAEEIDGKLVQILPSGGRVTYTIDPTTQRSLEKLYSQYKIPYGGLVIVEPATGRVLAMISQTGPGKDDVGAVALEDIAPSASVFKIVTIAALIEGEKLSPSEKHCYHGGVRSLTKKNIEGDARLDNRCGDLSDAMAWSINSMVAKLAHKHLSKKELQSWAERFGYNQEIPFELPLKPSTVEIVDDPHERARSAAGFWHSTLSPMHGALIAAAVLNDGVMMRPSMIESYETPDGKILKRFEPEVFKRVVSKSTASTLKSMMSRTTKVGTARKYFAQRSEFPRDILTGGKTGTLSRKSPSYLGYTWFVGYGEDAKQSDIGVAVGGLVCNEPIWHIKGPYASSEAIRIAIQSLRDHKKKG